MDVMTSKFRRRTFGDLLPGQPGFSTLHRSCRCSFCKRDRLNDPDYLGARAYSVRHYICDQCLEPRKTEILPSVKRREAFNRRLDQASQS